jgi:hypothetical protein
VVLVNFGEICKTLNRSMDHVYSFMLAEMGTTGSIDASSRMVIKGRFPPKAIEQIIRRCKPRAHRTACHVRRGAAGHTDVGGVRRRTRRRRRTRIQTWRRTAAG